MKVTFLGTSAANAYPEAFCQCGNCQQARALGGKSLRKRSSILVNDDLLIDLGPDIMAAAQQHVCPLVNVQHCLQTHPHADHMDLSHLLSRSPGFGVVGAPRLHFYASPETIHWASLTFERDMAGFSLEEPQVETELNLNIHPIPILEFFQAGPYKCMALPANHHPRPGAVMYAVEMDGKSLLYATDTAAFPEQTWEALRQFNLKFDLAILDHTYGPGHPGGDHLSAHQVIKHLQRMRADGIFRASSRLFGTHIAHESNPPHPELETFAHQNGYEIAFDGLALDI
jgi:phosphoribosyl 1,2-cyclic phosphate phosphodiesterase